MGWSQVNGQVLVLSGGGTPQIKENQPKPPSMCDTLQRYHHHGKSATGLQDLKDETSNLDGSQQTKTKKNPTKSFQRLTNNNY